MNEMLHVDAISIRFGGLQAVDGVSFAVGEGELLGLIGPNGAGKTTALRLITGVLKVDSGRILIAGTDVTRLPTHRRVRRGIALTHQIVKPFRSLSVLDNVVLAAGLKRTRNALGALFQVGRCDEERKARGILERVGLEDYADAEPDMLPLGLLKRLEVARALALDPRIVLLDEPLAGLNQKEATRLADTIVELNRDGLTVVLVEHNLGEILRVVSRLVVLDSGAVIADGPPDTVIADPRVRNAYLGIGEDEHAAA
jgi:branched-chain amino acid transport system ATP-binding protein